MIPYPFTKESRRKVADSLRNGEVLVFPTETVYGLAGNAYSNKSVSKIFTLKKRPAINPLIIHFKNLKDLSKEAIINKTFTKLYKAFCPGPITFILKKKQKSRVYNIATARKKTIAVRIPKHKTARNLLKN